MALPNTLVAKRYDGRSPISEPVTMIWSGTAIKVIGASVTQNYLLDQVSISPRIGKADRFVALPDGSQLQCTDGPLLDRLRQEGEAEGVVAWLEQRWHIAIASVAITFASLGLGYVYGLPTLASHIAARVPIEYERDFGAKVILWLDEQKFFQPTKLDDDARQRIATGFAQLSQDLPMAPHLRLEFRDAPRIGANALALPGGIIVITDQLIHLSESTEEVLAVLAHEIGHVEYRHALRHVVQDSTTAAIAAAFTSDVSSLTLAVSGVPVLLAQANYSREFETEADDFGFALLKRHDISPEHFATLMERLNAMHGDKNERQLAFLSTHPVTAERIARARAAAQQQSPPESRHEPSRD
jgi:predicted Zn-dependent protease